jgi:hypothetical protein
MSIRSVPAAAVSRWVNTPMEEKVRSLRVRLTVLHLRKEGSEYGRVVN